MFGLEMTIFPFIRPYQAFTVYFTLPEDGKVENTARVKLYDGGGAQYGENCISQKSALQRDMQLPS